VKQSPDSKFKGENGPDRKILDRLEAMLLLWEENMAYERLGALFREKFLTNAQLSRMEWFPSAILDQQVLHYSEFRRHVLSLREMEGFDKDRFGNFSRMADNSRPSQTRVDALLAAFPGLLAQWRVDSSRVYSSSQDLELMWIGTRLGDLGWSDVHFPFRAFAISLEKPILFQGNPHDFILVNIVDTPGDTTGEGKSLLVGIFPESLSGFKNPAPPRR